MDGRIKGAAFREFVRWCERDLGPERLAQVVRVLPEHARARLAPGTEALGVLASTWYPADVVHALLDGIVHGLGVGERERIAREGARAVMESTLHGVYKLLFDWIATPSRYAKFAGKLWSSYYDSGQFEVTMEGDHQAVSTIRDWRTHHPLICDLNREAAAAIYEAMGCRDVSVERTQCVERHDPHCRFVIRWEPRDH